MQQGATEGGDVQNTLGTLRGAAHNLWEKAESLQELVVGMNKLFNHVHDRLAQQHCVLDCAQAGA